MKEIWLINPYGPIEGEDWRDYSFNQFGKYLSENGYKVIWWTSNFAHHFKEYRSVAWKDISVNSNYKIRLVPSTKYSKNLGIGRFVKDISFAYNCYNRMKKENRPSIILTAETPLTFGYPGFVYSRRFDVPIIYDQMDLWPEFIENAFGKNTAKLLHVFFEPIYKNRKKNYDKANGVIALANNYLKKSLEISPILANKPNALIYNGIDVKEFRRNMYFGEVPINLKRKDKNEIWFIFAGTLGPSYDIFNILNCIKRINDKDKELALRIKFIIAGSGPLEKNIVDATRKYNNLIYLGKLPSKELTKVYRMCDVGLSAYTSKSNVDMPDKFYDYTAAGLCVINSLTGEVKDYINKYYVGTNYEAGNIDSLYKSIIEVTYLDKLNLMKSNSKKLGDFFDSNIQNEKLINVINKVLESNKIKVN